jgi:hypothetical protein
MNATLVKATFALVPVSVLFGYSVAVVARRTTMPSVLQLVGATGLVVVVLTHICEAIHLLPAMHWGEPHSVGHYLDLSSALLGVTLLPAGFLMRVYRGDVANN